MRQTEAFSLAEQSCKLLVFFVEIKERIKIAVIVCLEVIADVARMRLLINPLADRSLTALFVEGCLLHFADLVETAEKKQIGRASCRERVC